MSEEKIPLEHLSDRELLVLAVQMLRAHDEMIKHHDGRITEHERLINYGKGIVAAFSAIFGVQFGTHIMGKH